MDPFLAKRARRSIAITPVTAGAWQKFRQTIDKPAQRWAAAQDFTAQPGGALILPGRDGAAARVLSGVAETPGRWALSHLPSMLPAGHYHLDAPWSEPVLRDALIGFGLAQYQFSRYKSLPRKSQQLHAAGADLASVRRAVAAVNLVRDLINTPPADMGPQALAAAAKALAKQTGMNFREIVGEALLRENYPAIHAVGRAASEAPRLLDLRWGEARHPRLTLIGKGVTFDTGGLDLKPYSSMKLMKKDMGGAALVLGLAQMIVGEGLGVRLRVLIPAVENAIGSRAYRPQDVLRSRKGLTIEIGSTDAEGRVILADALAEAESEAPDLIIDAATLTGAARTALGTELPALFCNRDELRDELARVSLAVQDPLWPLPLWPGYDAYVNSPVADITNSPNYSFAGSITAALFLQRFITPRTPWIHLDTYAWNAESRPGRPAGGEALGLFSLMALLRARYPARA